MTKNVCKSCGSDRCGNHAACERRQVFIRAQREKLDVEWACFSALMYVDMRSKDRLPTVEAEILELDQIRKESPLVFQVLEEIARRRARAMVADAILLSALADIFGVKTPTKEVS